MWRRAHTAVSPSPPRKRGLPLSVSGPKPNLPKAVAFNGLRMSSTMKAWARRAQKVSFHFQCRVFVYLFTKPRQQYAASTTNHARLVNPPTNHPHLLPPTPTASPTPAELSLRIAVESSAMTQTDHATMIMPTLIIRTALERASRKSASPARMPTRECPEERPPRRTES